ncbi:MAG: hypothetical protein ACE5DM_00060 [Candidatus Nanoarchaeia archaeon]
MRRFGSSGPTGEDSSGIGNFMGAVSDSSDEVLGDITDRYGDQNVFTDQFSTSSIAKGACIFAFTGEWPSNFGSLLDSAIDIPIQSFSSVYPAERRFVAYDLEGNAIFNYHVALSFFSGAPTRARLELVCSGADVQCPEDGRQFAKCDCAENGEQTYQVQLSQCEPSCPDAYSQDQDCTTECFIRMEHSKVRYDRARFVWDWTGSRQTQGIAGPALGQTAAKPGDLSGKQEKEITEIQGPPFDLCHFDATELRYRCGFGSTTDDYARIADVRLAEPPDQQEGQQPLFKVGDYHILNMDIIQKTPEKEMERCGLGDCKSTKYLSVVIRNQGGAVVWPKGYNPVSTSVPGAVPVGVQPDKSKPPAATSNPVSLPPALKLNGNSRHQLAFFDIIDFESFTQATDKFEITREMFTVSPTKRKAKTSSGSGVNNPSKSCYSQSCAISGLACDENTVPKSKIGKDQGLQLIVSKDKITYRPVRIVQKGSGPIKLDPIDGAPAQNCEHKNGKLKCGDSTFLLSDKVKIESLVTGKKSVACTVYFKDRSKKAEKPASLPGVSTGGTLPGACTSQPQTWTAEVTLWDAQKDGTSYRMSPQVSVAPDGQVNRKNIAFKVACAERQGEYESEYTKISQIGARSASYTVEKHHDYGIDARRMEGDETVTIANYRRIGPVDFEVDILVEAMIVDLNIDVGVEGLDANSPELKISKTGVKNPLPRCKMDDPNNPQPRPCYTTTKDGKYLNLYLRRGDPRYTFEGFISSEVYRAEEGTACRAPYEDGVCAYDEMWDCVAEGGSEVAGLNPSASGIPVRTDEIHLITGILENKTLVYGFVKNQSGKSDGFEKVMFYNSDDQAVTGVVNITAVSEGLTMYAGKFFTVRSGSLVSSPLDKYDDAKALLTAGKRSYLGQGACDGQNCCGVGETKCCPTGKLVPKYKDSEAQSCKKEGTPALCISNEFTCIEGEPNKVKATRPYGFGTGEGKNQKLKTKQCPGSSVCCPTGNYKKERRKVAKASFSGVGGGVKTPEKESTVSNKIPAGTSGGACMDTKDCKCAYTCPTEMKYDTPDYSDCKEGLTPCRTVKESGKLGGACVGQTVEECVCAIPDDCDQGYPGINLCSGGATPCKKMKTQGPLGTKKLPGYPNVYCGKEGLGGNVFNYEGLNNNCQALMPSHPGVYYNAYCTGPVSQLNDNQACPSNACCACKGTVIPAGGCCNADNPGAPCEGPADVYMGGTKVTEFTDYGEVCDKDYCFCGTTTPRKDKVTTKGSCCKFWVQTKDNCPSGVPMPCGCNGPAWEKCFYCPK